MENCLESTRPQVTVSIHDTYQLQVTQIFGLETMKGTARHIRVSCKFAQRTDGQELLSKVIQNGAAVKNEEELSTSHSFSLVQNRAERDCVRQGKECAYVSSAVGLSYATGCMRLG